MIPYVSSEHISYSDESDYDGLGLWPNEPDSLATYSLPSIQIHCIGNRVVQSTDNLSQPWTDVTNMTSPPTINTETSPSQFFRFSE